MSELQAYISASNKGNWFLYNTFFYIVSIIFPLISNIEVVTVLAEVQAF